MDMSRLFSGIFIFANIICEQFLFTLLAFQHSTLRVVYFEIFLLVQCDALEIRLRCQEVEFDKNEVQLARRINQ